MRKQKMEQKGILVRQGQKEEGAEPSFFRMTGRNEISEEVREGGKMTCTQFLLKLFSPTHTCKLVGGVWRWAPANRYVTHRLCAFDFICHFLHCKYQRHVSFFAYRLCNNCSPRLFPALSSSHFLSPPLLLYLFPPRHLKVFDDRCEVLDVMTMMTYGCTKMIFLYE